MARHARCSALLLLAAAPAAWGQDPYPSRQYSTGVFPQHVRAVDLDADGVADLVVPNKTSAFVSFLKGNADGSFAPATSITLPSAIGVTLSTGDLNLDAKTDLVVGGATVLSVVPALGGGAFGPGSLFSAGGTPISSAVGFFNADANPDVVLATTAGNLVVHPGLGTGALGAPTTQAFGLQPQVHHSMADGDLNGDGKTDLAVTNFTAGTLTAAYGNGTGGFATPLTVTVPANPIACAMGDLNLDGFVDVLSASRAPSNSVSVSFNNTLGNLLPAQTYAVAGDPRGVAIGRCDGDLLPDAYVACNDLAASGVAVLRNLGGGTLGAPARFAAGNQPFAVTAADLNGDSAADAVAVNTNSYSVATVFADGAGALVSSSTVPTGDAARILALGDLNEDGKLDVATANTAFFAISFSMGTGAASFGAPSTISTAGPPQNVVIADMGGDSNLDLVVASTSPARVFVFPGNGVGGFAAAQSTTTPSAAKGVAVGDFTSDGRPDAVVIHNTTNSVSVLPGLVSGGFGAATTSPTGTTPTAIATGDLTGDGQLDVVTGNSGSLSVLASLGTGAFAAPATTAVAGNASSVAVGDLDGDGALDAATANATNATLSILKNVAGVLQAPQALTVGTFSQSRAGFVAIGDVDADGKADLVTTNSNLVDCNITYFRGTGVGAFAAGISYGLEATVASLQLADLDADSDLDVVAALETTDRLSILLHLGKPATGVSSFGTGTPGCQGTLGMGTRGAASITGTGFAFVSSNLPPQSLALLLLADAQDVAGFDYFGVNLTIHLNPLAATYFDNAPVQAGASGELVLPVTVPNSPPLVGQTYFGQVIGVQPASAGQTCSPISFFLDSSRGVAMTIQP